jgi:hypothetical protein
MRCPSAARSAWHLCQAATLDNGQWLTQPRARSSRSAAPKPATVAAGAKAARPRPPRSRVLVQARPRVGGAIGGGDRQRVSGGRGGGGEVPFEACRDGCAGEKSTREGEEN